MSIKKGENENDIWKSKWSITTYKETIWECGGGLKQEVSKRYELVDGVKKLVFQNTEYIVKDGQIVMDLQTLFSKNIMDSNRGTYSYVTYNSKRAIRLQNTGVGQTWRFTYNPNQKLIIKGTIGIYMEKADAGGYGTDNFLNFFGTRYTFRRSGGISSTSATKTFANYTQMQHYTDRAGSYTFDCWGFQSYQNTGGSTYCNYYLWFDNDCSIYIDS